MKTLKRAFRRSFTLIALCGLLSLAAAGCAVPPPQPPASPQPKPATAAAPAPQANESVTAAVPAPQAKESVTAAAPAPQANESVTAAAPVPQPKLATATAAKGDTVFVEYTGKLENGEVFDSTAKHGGEPLKVVIGQTPLITGFTKGLIGMTVGEARTLTLPPDEAYGPRDQSKAATLAKGDLGDAAARAKAGEELAFTYQGRPAKALVKEVTEDSVVFDTNHKLAGKTLIFEVKLVRLVKKGQ